MLLEQEEKEKERTKSDERFRGTRINYVIEAELRKCT
jgi:hypothetical protein